MAYGWVVVWAGIPQAPGPEAGKMGHVTVVQMGHGVAQKGHGERIGERSLPVIAQGAVNVVEQVLLRIVNSWQLWEVVAVDDRRHGDLWMHSKVSILPFCECCRNLDAGCTDMTWQELQFRIISFRGCLAHQ
jgi:hypothetical protein